MNVHQYHYRPRQSGDGQIVIMPSSAQYAERMARLHQIGYGYTAADITEYDESLTPEKFLHHLTMFPKGQFIAVDTVTREVVGLTVSMRLNYDLHHPRHHSWSDTTDWG